MGLFRTKSAEEKAATLAEQMVLSRFIRARGDLYEAVYEAATSGGADPTWVSTVMPSLAQETAEAWLAVHPNPSAADLEDLWQKDLRTFWNRSYWDDFDTATKDLAQEISVAVQREVVRLNELRMKAAEAAASAADRQKSGDDDEESGLLVPRWSDEPAAAADTPGDDGSTGLPDTAPASIPLSVAKPSEVPPPEPAAPAVSVARAIEVWRWANAEQLSESARSRLDRVARLVGDNPIGFEDVAEERSPEQIRFDQTVADMKHGREMIEHVGRWIADDPARFNVSLGLYLDGGGAGDGLDVESDRD